MAEYHDELRDSLSRALARLEWDKLRVRHRQEQIRHLECALATADITEAAVAAHVNEWRPIS